MLSSLNPSVFACSCAAIEVAIRAMLRQHDPGSVPCAQRKITNSWIMDNMESYNEKSVK